MLETRRPLTKVNMQLPQSKVQAKITKEECTY